MTLGFDAPLPPARTGVADYAAVLLAELRRRASVVLRGERADRWLYHIGNNKEHHAAIYRRALARPGVVVLHDAVLMHLQLSMAADENAFAEEFVYNYGGWHEDFARRLWRERGRSGADAEYFRWPMLKRLAESAEALIVHNPGAAERVRQHAPRARVVEIPHLAFDADARAERIGELRRRWRAGMSTYVFGVFGHLRESKRLLPILRTFAVVGDARLVLAGPAQSEALERALEPLCGENVCRMPALSDEDLRAAIAAIDAGLCLRWPSAGETSGMSIRMMAAAKPVLMTRTPETDPFLEGACIKIEPGPMEEPHLRETMEWMLWDPGATRRIGSLAREHIRREHAPGRVAERYLEVLQ